MAMPLQSGAERDLNFVDLEGGEPDILALVGLRVEKENCDFSLCDIVVEDGLNNVSGTALDVAYERRV